MFLLTVDHVTEPPGDRPSCADKANDVDFPVSKQMKKICFWLMIPLLSAVLSHSVMSDSLQPHGLYPARLLCPWGFSR